MYVTNVRKAFEYLEEMGIFNEDEINETLEKRISSLLDDLFDSPNGWHIIEPPVPVTLDRVEG